MTRQSKRAREQQSRGHREAEKRHRRETGRSTSERSTPSEATPDHQERRHRARLLPEAQPGSPPDPDKLAHHHQGSGALPEEGMDRKYSPADMQVRQRAAWGVGALFGGGCVLGLGESGVVDEGAPAWGGEGASKYTQRRLAPALDANSTMPRCSIDTVQMHADGR